MFYELLRMPEVGFKSMELQDEMISLHVIIFKQQKCSEDVNLEKISILFIGFQI